MRKLFIVLVALAALTSGCNEVTGDRQSANPSSSSTPTEFSSLPQAAPSGGTTTSEATSPVSADNSSYTPDYSVPAPVADPDPEETPTSTMPSGELCTVTDTTNSNGPYSLYCELGSTVVIHFDNGGYVTIDDAEYDGTQYEGYDAEGRCWVVVP